MHDKSTRLGALAIPVYGLAVFLSILSHQPDPPNRLPRLRRVVTTASFLVSHLVGRILGTTIGILGCWRWLPSWPPPAWAASRCRDWS
jgi:hypothetical protein